MKINLLLLAIITATITSCSTSYKTGQTPDDVYYSPARLQTDNVRRDDDNKKVQDNSVYTAPEDREIRRRVVHNRRYRRYDDRYDYPYGYNNGYNNEYNNGYPIYTNPKINTTQNTSQPRKTNLGAYSPDTTPDSVKVFNSKLGNQNNTSPTNPVRTFSIPVAPNNGTPLGNLLRRVFNGDSNPNNNYHNSYPNNSSRTFESNNTNNNYNNSNSRSFESTSNKSNTNNNNNNSNTQSAPTTNSTSAPVRTFKKDN